MENEVNEVRSSDTLHELITRDDGVQDNTTCRSGWIMLTTTGDDKDDNSTVSAEVIVRGASLLMEIPYTLNGIKLGKGVSTPPIALTLRAIENKNDCAKGSIRLRFQTHGNDTWEYMLRLHLEYTDGQSLEYLWGGKLTQDQPTNQYDWK